MKLGFQHRLGLYNKAEVQQSIVLPATNFSGLTVFKQDKPDMANSRIHGHLELMFNRLNELDDKQISVLSKKSAIVKLGGVRYRFNRIFYPLSEVNQDIVMSWQLSPAENRLQKRQKINRYELKKEVPHTGFRKWLAKLKIIPEMRTVTTFESRKEISEEVKKLPTLHFMRHRTIKQVKNGQLVELGLYDPVIRLATSQRTFSADNDFEFISHHPKLVDEADAFFTLLDEKVFGPSE